MQTPYIKKLTKTYHNLTICIVDAGYIRSHIDNNFTNAGEHYAFKYIPKNEIWIDQNVEPKEIPVLAKEMYIEFQNMSKGKRYDPAYEKGYKVAQKLRHELPNDQTVKIKQLLEVKGLKVFLVDGFEVRKTYNQDFVEGGHGRVYEYIPKNEIWLEKDNEPKDMEYIFLHEITEYNLMGNKHMSYAHAHELANVNETKARKHKESIKDAIIKEFKKLKV